MQIWEKRFTTVLQYNIILFFSAAVLLYIINVLLRLFSESSFPWISPLINYLFVLAALMGAAYGVRRNENIKIEIFSKFSATKSLRAILYLVAIIASVFIVAVFFMDFLRSVPWRPLIHQAETMNNAGRCIGIILLNSLSGLFTLAEKSEFFIPRWLLNIPYILFFLLTVFYYTLLFLQTLKAKDKKDEL